MARSRTSRGHVTVRRARIQDAPGIARIYAGEPEGFPLRNPSLGAVWTNHRLLRGYGIDVAVRRGRVVGHAEWVLSDEPRPWGRHLALEMLETHPEARRQGVGRRMIEHGIARARELGCRWVTTVPEDEARPFYERCGFGPHRNLVSFTVPGRRAALPRGWSRVRRVPAHVVRELPLRLGRVQASSAHLWEIANRPLREAAGSDMRHPAARSADGRAFVQLRMRRGRPSAFALAWAEPRRSLSALVAVATAMAGPSSERLGLTVDSREAGRLVGLERDDTHEVWRANPADPSHSHRAPGNV
jgi:GNAT superfamily N-acetyltransferase